MKIELSNLGALQQAEFELGDMTIICGSNNTGKTYATYATYGFLRFWNEAYVVPVNMSYINQLFENSSVKIPLAEFRKDRNVYLKAASEQYSEQLYIVFAGNEKYFEHSSFSIMLEEPDKCPEVELERNFGTEKKRLFKISKSKNNDFMEVSLLLQDEESNLDKNAVKKTIGNAVKDILFGHLFPETFIASAERTGAAIFRKELNFARNRLLEEVGQGQEINPLDLINKVYSDYALPVKHNVDFTRKLEDMSKTESYIAKKHPELLEHFEDILGGTYKVTNNDELYFIPNANKSVRLTMDESSSAVRSLLDIGFYLKHAATEGDLLMIDEPELNLHPQNQRKIARLFACLVNSGLRVFITTHSDYIIKELNTLIMLNSDEQYIKKIIEKENYRKSEIMSPEQIKVYIAKKASVKKNGNKRPSQCLTLVPAEITNQYGIELDSFDDTIIDMNRIQEEILFGGDD